MRRELDRIAAQQQRKMLASFRAVVSDIREQAVLSELVRSLEAGNVDNVLFLLGMDANKWEPMAEQIRESYRTGGLVTASMIGRIKTPSGTVNALFGMRSVGAEQWVRNESARFIVEIVGPQIEMVRRFVADGLAAGANPRTMAYDIVGRIDKATGKRTGGIIGMTEQQAGWVRSARQELQELNPNYLTRKLRDPRFDKLVNDAISNDAPLSAKQIDAAITRMSEKTLTYRGESIARTESISALRAGQVESIEQAMTLGEVDRRDVRKAWGDTGRDGRTRESHIQAGIDYADGIPFDQPFIVGGEAMMHVGDIGASAENVINCRCQERFVIDFAGQLKRIEGFS